MIFIRKMKKLKNKIKDIYNKYKNKNKEKFENNLNNYIKILKKDIIKKKKNVILQFFPFIDFSDEPKIKQFKDNTSIKNCKIILSSDYIPDLFLSPIEFLITDSIFCLYQIINHFNMYDISYRTNYSFIASVHEKMGNWCFYYNAYRVYMDNNKDSERIQKHLEKLIGSENPSTLTPNYHFELAVQYYESAIQVHTEGKAYKHLIKKMDYFNDDYNSELYHFSAAMERYNLNTKRIRDKYERIRARVRAATVNSYESYSSREMVRNRRHPIN